METIPFKEAEVKKYLDDCIVYWRKWREAGGATNVEAIFYIDAYQSVRTSLFGELLPESPAEKA